MIDQDWSNDDRESLQLAVDFWETVLEIEIQTEIAPCVSFQKDCLTKVKKSSSDLMIDGVRRNGVGYAGGGAVISEAMKGEALSLVAAHEMGHMFGLTHGHGLMDKDLQADTWELSDVQVTIAKNRI